MYAPNADKDESEKDLYAHNADKDESEKDLNNLIADFNDSNHSKIVISIKYIYKIDSFILWNVFNNRTLRIHKINM